MVDRQSELAGHEETIEVVEDSRAGDARPAEPEQPLRDEARRLVEELELLGREQRAALEQQEARAKRIVALLRASESDLAARSRALAEAERRHSTVADEQRRRSSQLAESEQALERREGVLDAAERTAADHERQLAAVEQELDSRSRELSGERETIESERRALAEKARRVEQELGERENALRSRETALAGREGELAREATRLAELSGQLAEREGLLQAEKAKVAEHERALEQREKGVAARELLAQRVMPARPAEPRAAGRVFSIDALERLVVARSAEFPDRAGEWEAYLFQLRTKAGADGSLPATMTGLVEDVFAPLV